MRWKLMIKKEIDERLVKEIHELYGHCGVRRTYELFKEYFTGDHLYRFTKQMIKTCDVCQRCKEHCRRGIGQTKPIVPKEKGELVSIDYYRPLLTLSLIHISSHRHKTGWKQVNNNNEPDWRESTQIPSKRVYESHVNAIAGTSETQGHSPTINTRETNSKH